MTATSSLNGITYPELSKQLQSLITGDPHPISQLSNASALLNQYLNDINWVGFYFAKQETLLLGPFQGNPACNPIPFSKGVCGKAAREKEIQLVDDVNAFPGHIACDARSRSEIVLPIINTKTGELVAVLDIDSPSLARFKEEDKEGLKAIAEIISNETLWDDFHP